MELKPYFMISESDGGLYDTRQPKWAANPMRPNYSRHFATIETTAQFRATIRAGGYAWSGGYAWPGGYSIALYCSDGGVLCFTCGRANAAAIMDSIKKDCRDGWRVIGCGVQYDGEESGVNCDHCNEVISEGESIEEDSDWQVVFHHGVGWRGVRGEAESDSDVTDYCATESDARAAIELQGEPDGN